MQSVSAAMAQLLEMAGTPEERIDISRCDQLRAGLGAQGARWSLARPQGVLLYRLVRHLQPDKVVEFGTCLGISGSYLASALQRNGHGQLVTVERLPERSAAAGRSIDSVAPGVTRIVAGCFDDHLDELDGSGLFFLDGDHFAEETRTYVDAACDRADRPCLIVLDDVYAFSREMRSVWRELRRSDRCSAWGEDNRIGVLCLGNVSIGAASRSRRNPLATLDAALHHSWPAALLAERRRR